MTKPSQQTNETTGTNPLPEQLNFPTENKLKIAVQQQVLSQMAPYSLDLCNIKLEYDTRLKSLAADVKDNERFLRMYSSAASVCIMILVISQLYLLSRLL